MILDRYLLIGATKSIALCLMTLLGVLYVGEVYAHMEALKGGPWEPMMLGALKLVVDSAWIVPLAGVLGLSLFFAKLRRTQELFVLWGSGLSGLRALRSVWGLVFLAIAWAFLVECYIGPQAQALQETVKGRAGHFLKTYAYDSPGGRERWVVNRLEGPHAQGISLSLLNRAQDSPHPVEALRFLAKTADYDPLSQAWVFYEGRVLVFKDGTLLESTPFLEKSYHSDHVTPQILSWSRSRPEDLSLSALFTLFSTGHRTQTLLLLFAARLSLLLRPLLAFLLALWGAHKVPMRASPLGGIVLATSAYVGVCALASLLRFF